MIRAFLVLAAAALPAASPPPARVYAVVRVGSVLDPAAVVGRKRAGALCLPNGAIRWSDVAAGTATDQRELVQDALEDAGVAVTPFGEAQDRRGTARLRATVQAARFDLCARRWGLGDGKAMSGEAGITVEWRVEDGVAPPRVHRSVVSQTVPASAGAPVGALYRALLGQAARDAAGWLAAASDVPAA
jgi:hypothetical protein